MERRYFMGTIGAGMAAGPLTGRAETEDQPASGSRRLARTPAVLMAPRHDGAEIVWAVSESCLGRIEWRTDEGRSGVFEADHFGFVPQGDEVLRVRLEGLDPGRPYHWRARTESIDRKRVETSDWKTFRTLDPGADTSHFVVWNDTHEHDETIAALHRVTPAADFLVWNGDTCNDWHQPEWLAPVLLHPGGQDLSATRPLALTFGNHDVRGRWAYRAPDYIATPNGRPYYAFRSGPVAAIFLHTGEDKPDDHPSFGGRVAFETLRREQANWLESVIARPPFRDAPYRVIFCHIPLRGVEERVIEDYSDGSYDRYSLMSRREWHDKLVKWGAQVVISGHTHQPTLIEPNRKFPYAQMIGGGPQPERAVWIDGQADRENLILKSIALNGETIHEFTLTPLA